MRDSLLECVVIVDDCDDHRYLAQRAIQKAMIADQVVECADAETALEVLEARANHGSPESLTLALVDVNMPLMNGFDLLDRLKLRLAKAAERPRLIVAISSSSAHTIDVERALAHPLVDAYVSKPPHAEGLRDMVEAQLRLRQSRA